MSRCPGTLQRTLPRPLLNGVVEDKVRSCPGTRFVLEHLAAATTTSTYPAHLAAYTAAVESIAKLPNVQCIQLGGVASQWGAEGAIDKAAVGAYVKAAINAFGFSRVCFEGNWFFNNCMFLETVGIILAAGVVHCPRGCELHPAAAGNAVCRVCRALLTPVLAFVACCLVLAIRWCARFVSPGGAPNKPNLEVYGLW